MIININEEYSNLFGFAVCYVLKKLPRLIERRSFLKEFFSSGLNMANDCNDVKRGHSGCIRITILCPIKYQIGRRRSYNIRFVWLCRVAYQALCVI